MRALSANWMRDLCDVRDRISTDLYADGGSYVADGWQRCCRRMPGEGTAGGAAIAIASSKSAQVIHAETSENDRVSVTEPGEPGIVQRATRVGNEALADD